MFVLEGELLRMPWASASSQAWGSKQQRPGVGHTEQPEHLGSQNHRILGVGRDLWGSSSPTDLPQQGHLEQAAQDLVQAGFEHLQRRRLHNLSRQPVPVLCHPQSKEVLPRVQMEVPVLQFEPTAPCPVTGHHWKEFGPILLIPTFNILVSIYKIPVMFVSRRGLLAQYCWIKWNHDKLMLQMSYEQEKLWGSSSNIFAIWTKFFCWKKAMVSLAICDHLGLRTGLQVSHKRMDL